MTDSADDSTNGTIDADSALVVADKPKGALQFLGPAPPPAPAVPDAPAPVPVPASPVPVPASPVPVPASPVPVPASPARKGLMHWLRERLAAFVAPPSDRTRVVGNESAGNGLLSTATRIPAESAEAEAMTKELKARGRTAFCLGLIAFGALGYTFWHSDKQIRELLKTPPADFRLAIVGIAGHAVMTIAVVWFAYQMLRAVERLLIPRYLYTVGQDAEIIRALTGVESPAQGATKEAKALLAHVGEVVKLATEITTVTTARADKSEHRK